MINNILYIRQNDQLFSILQRRIPKHKIGITYYVTLINKVRHFYRLFIFLNKFIIICFEFLVIIFYNYFNK